MVKFVKERDVRRKCFALQFRRSALRVGRGAWYASLPLCPDMSGLPFSKNGSIIML